MTPEENRLNAALDQLGKWVDQQAHWWAPAQAPAELFHYTSPDGFIGIARSRSLWASDMLTLNDASEAQYPQRLIAQLIEKYAAEVPDEHRSRFTDQLRNYLFTMYTPFVTCFCESGDLLSQWRGYGNDGEGFALGFSGNWLQALEKKRFRLQRIIYDRAQQEDLVLMFLTMATDFMTKADLPEAETLTFWQAAASCLAPWVVMFKDPTFSEEREWRLVNVDAVTRGLAFRRAGQRIVPYIEIPVTDGALVRVVRGPFFAGTETRTALMMLQASGLGKGVLVQESNIPLRR